MMSWKILRSRRPVTSLAPPGTSTEAVCWLSGAIRLGLATGTALAGPLDGRFAAPLMAAALVRAPPGRPHRVRAGGADVLGHGAGKLGQALCASRGDG
ncbi:hypothetical protein AB0M39_01355 [Streptomyces sp. NPDC051907]|uniref:hypothetical protein n=1 Tax=Streptomyces sp. NPDC051907 TaxID=3155284 RepID=UPI00341872C5